MTETLTAEDLGSLLLDSHEAADYLGMNFKAFWRHLEKGHVRSLKKGRDHYFTHAELDQFQARRRKPGRPADPVNRWVDCEKLRGLRLDSGLSQDNLAEELGISQGHLAAIESGLRQPSAALFRRLQSWIAGAEDEYPNWRS
jgi:DNA-binding XRE family transcriptional regulator